MCVVDGSHRKHSHYLHDYVYGCLKDYTDKETILVLNKVFFLNLSKFFNAVAYLISANKNILWAF